MKTIPVENIKPNGLNRKNSELTLIPSVKTDGVLEPIIVYKEKGESVFTIAAGHRRYASAVNFGLETIPCIVMTKDKAIRAAALENLDREDLSPADLCDSVLSLYEESGYCIDDIAAVTKLRKNQVVRLLRIRDCIPEVRQNLKDKVYTVEQALEYAPFSQEVQTKVFKELGKSTSIKPSSIRSFLNAKVGKSLAECTDDIVESNLYCGHSCLECEHNLACDGVLFCDGVTKEESVCSKVANYYGKYTEYAKSLGVDYITSSEIETAGYTEGKKGYFSYDDSYKQNHEGYTEAIDENGKRCFGGGKFITPPSAVNPEIKELEESLEKEEKWLEELLESVTKNIMKRLYGESAKKIIETLNTLDKTSQNAFVAVLEHSDMELEKDDDLNYKLMHSLMDQHPGIISKYSTIYRIKAGDKPSEIFKKYYDHLAGTEDADDIRRIDVTATNIRDFNNKLKELRKKEASK